MSKQVRINVRTLVNAAKIRKEKRNGRDVMVIPSATLPDGVVMNSIRYPAAAIEASYKTLERSLAPLGHPKGPDGGFLSSRDPEAINRHHIGAWNENVRRENGRVYLDKVIDLELANATEGGKRVLEAIKKGDPIHTSTGLLATLKPLENDDAAKFEVADMVFDHDAIMLDEPGAAGPEQGVGMLVNGKQIEVINSELDEMTDRRLDYAIQEVARALDEKRRAPMLSRIKDTLLSILGAGEGDTDPEDEKEAEMATDPKEDPVMAEEKNADAAADAGLKGQVEQLAAAVAKIMARFEAEDKVKEDAVAAEKATLEEAVANAGMMTADEAKAAPVEALRVLANAAKNATAAPIVGRYVNRKAPTDLAAMFPSEA